MGSASPSSLVQLANLIKESATTLDSYVVTHNHPSPSLGVDGVHGNEVLCLQAIYRYEIASSFGTYEQPSFEEVSGACGLNVQDLRRIVRYAMTDNIFCEPRPGHIAHTAASRLLAQNSLVNDFVGNVCEIRFPASARTMDAVQKYGKSRESNQSGFSLARNTSRGLYEEFSHETELSRRFNGAMRALASEIDFQFILHSFPWTSYNSPTILDIGGGCGDVSFGLKPHVPTASFIVQDSSETARKQGECILATTAARGITFQAYSFHTPQPVQGADVYYFRNVFHNWPDKDCLSILRHQIPSFKKGARLVIDDCTLHEPGTLQPTQERKRRWMDINMLIFFGSHERTIEEWKTLLTEADPRFDLINVNKATDQPNMILDVAWTG
ncbi:MAG: hypothetical protein Q9166_005224 [cf. Caloplaca sp. 2 TL-2023]